MSSPSHGEDDATTTTMDATKRPDGSVQQQDRPMRSKRRESIDSFLAHLSAWDLLYIRSRFRDGKIAIDGFAGLSELPPEVFASVVPYLELEDILNCYQVCRSWRKAWTQGAVATALCRRFFPGLLELCDGDEVRDRHDLFLGATKKYLRRHQTRCHGRAFVSWDIGWSSDDFRNEQQQPSVELLEGLRRVDFGYSHLTVCYESGKVAWQPGDCYVLIDDLRTRQRHRLSFGIEYISGKPLQLQTVTESLVVLAVTLSPFSNPNVMVPGQAIQVFHLDSKESKRIALPGVFARCYAQGDRAVFVTRQGHVVAWNWGGRAVELVVDRHELLRRPVGWERDLCGEPGEPGVLHHPSVPNVLYVVWFYSVAPPDTRINAVVVVKYENLQPVARFETAIRHPRYQRNLDGRESFPAMRFTLHCRRANSHGLCTLAIARFVLPDARQWPGHHDDPEEAEWISVGFNVLTETFVTREYRSQRPPYPRKVEHFDACVWDDQLIITWFDEYLIGRQYPYGMQWLDASSVVGEEEQQAAAAGRHSREVDGLAKRHRLDICAYMLDVGFGRRIFADEDFLIVSTGQGYLVCSWDKDVKLPGEVAARTADGRLQNPPWPVARERLEPPRLPNWWDCRTVTSLKLI